MREHLGLLQSGEVVVDRYLSHRHLEVDKVLADGLARLSSDSQDFFVSEVDFGRIIGENVCVATDHRDCVVFAKRKDRWGLTRFVLNRVPEPCTSMVIILKKGHRPGEYVLITAFVGKQAQPEPWDRNATAMSFQFWSNQALIWGSQAVICPRCRREDLKTGASQRVGDLMICELCVEKPTRLTHQKFAGWGYLKTPA